MPFRARLSRATLSRVTLFRVTPFLLTSLAFCGGDRSRSPTCGLAQVAGPALIQQQLTKLPFVLIYESQRPPPTYPQLGEVGGGDRSIPLYGVRVDWPSVSNPRCPLLGTPVEPPA